MQPLRILQYGLGPIGLLTAEAVLDKSAGGRVALVAAVDLHPAKAGRDVSDLLAEEGRPSRGASGVIVQEDARLALEETRPDVVLHTTSSFLDRVVDQIALCVEAGAHVVSSAEELSFPFERHPEIADRLDRLARQRGVVVVGSGVNPGYAMDALALTATGACTHVRSIRVERVVDASRRRLPLLAKIGVGITPRAFEERRAAGRFGHVGLRESLLLVARALGWTIERIDESLEPVLARRDAETRYLVVAKGDVAGIHQVARGFARDASGELVEVLCLDLEMSVGAENPRDSIFVDGQPPIELQVAGGIFGDTATAGALVNAVAALPRAAPGLRTVAELPLPRAFATVPAQGPLDHPEQT